MKNFKDLILRSKAVVIFKSVIEDKGITAFLNLLDCDGIDEKEFVSRYSQFVVELYEKTDDLCEYINLLLQNDENIYVKQSAKGEASPLLQKAVENELNFFEELSAISCDEIKSICETNVDLPQWKNGKNSVKAEYVKKISSIKTTGYGIYASHRMFLYTDEWL